jgi:CRISPR-associated protein Cmr6
MALARALSTILIIASRVFRRITISVYLPAVMSWRASIFTSFGVAVAALKPVGGISILWSFKTGLTLHATYGTPLIPGTALKGVASSYCQTVWGDAAPEGKSNDFRPGGDVFRVLFGSHDEGGLITFHDAWITPETLAGALRHDVMTPHHSAYYSESEGQTEPTDFDDPIPVPFLSVSGSFLVALSGAAVSEKWLNLASCLLKQALNHLGVGGKTNGGYGRLIAQ